MPILGLRVLVYIKPKVLKIITQLKQNSLIPMVTILDSLGTSSTAATPWRTPRPRSTFGSSLRSLSTTPNAPSLGCMSKLSHHQPVNYIQLDPTLSTSITPTPPAVDPLTWSSLTDPKHVALINKVSC